ncbi:MAG: hypothetical protein KJO40_19505 [Deltaproteobacteria bacterium]|nr:hypothetical protein [Deltaproteobacteria bacterium]
MSTEEQAAARDFVMARLGACRGAMAAASEALDQALGLFLMPDEDTKGKERVKLIELVDDCLGEAARAVQAAGELFEELDPAEGEPDLPEGDGEDPDDDDDDEGDDDD